MLLAQGARAERERLDTARVRRHQQRGARRGQWSYAYADKSLDDFHQLHAAAAAGEIEVADDPVR